MLEGGVPAMTTARYRLYKWNMLEAQALLDLSIARFDRKPTDALQAWADICAMRRSYWAEEWAHSP